MDGTSAEPIEMQVSGQRGYPASLAAFTKLESGSPSCVPLSIYNTLPSGGQGSCCRGQSWLSPSCWVLAEPILPLSYSQLYLTTAQAHHCGTGDFSSGWLWLENAKSLSTQFFLAPFFSQLSDLQCSFLPLLLLPPLYPSWTFLIKFYVAVSFKLT